MKRRKCKQCGSEDFIAVEGEGSEEAYVIVKCKNCEFDLVAVNKAIL